MEKISLKFRREERLKKRNDIKAVFNKGKCVTCQGAKLFVLQNSLRFNRIGFTFPRKFGNAAQRNRARRLSREAYRHIGYTLKKGYDMVLLVYPAGKDAFKNRAEQMRILISKAGLRQVYGN